MRELVVIRTHFFCDATARLYRFLKETSNRDVAFICDGNKASGAKLSEAFDEQFMSDLRIEASEEQYSAFEARLHAAISEAPA